MYHYIINLLSKVRFTIIAFTFIPAQVTSSIVLDSLSAEERISVWLNLSFNFIRSFIFMSNLTTNILTRTT